MPLLNLFKNCSYYWGFGAYVSYFINHPQYTEPSHTISLPLLAFAIICQISNFRSVAPHTRLLSSLAI